MLQEQYIIDSIVALQYKYWHKTIYLITLGSNHILEDKVQYILTQRLHMCTFHHISSGRYIPIEWIDRSLNSHNLADKVSHFSYMYNLGCRHTSFNDHKE